MQFIGHRGAKNEYPENTMGGFEWALQAGVDGLEVDVHRSQDGRLVVIHDPTLERTTNGRGLVAQTNWADLQRLDAGQGEKVPELYQVLEFVTEKNLHLFIESKVPDIERELVAEIAKAHAQKNCTVICFDHHFVRTVKSIAPEIRTGCLLVGTPIHPVALVRAASADLLALALKSVTPDLVQQCRDEEVQIAVWNANSKKEMNEMRALNVNYTMTDVPSLFADQT